MDKERLMQYLNAGYPAIWIQDLEDERVIRDLVDVANEGKNENCPMKLKVWSSTTGFLNYDVEKQKKQPSRDPICLLAKEKQDKSTKDPVAALNHVEENGDDYCLYVFKNFHFYLNQPLVIQKIRDLITLAKFNERHLIFISGESNLPIEIEKEIAVLTSALPDEAELHFILEGVIESIEESGTKVNRSFLSDLVESALGLSTLEAENAFAFAFVKHRQFDEAAIQTIQEMKTQCINRSGVLEYMPATYTIEDIGGLGALKEWLELRKKAFTPEAKAYGLPTPKGILLGGVPGSGKSLSAKALSASWNLPLLRFDVGKVFHSLVGESEQKMREALVLAEAMSPCILWIDEIEKAFSGTSFGGDGGVTARIFGQFLTWMQEKSAPVFIFATANHISSLPPEFLRKGRFDEFFFVDLPDFDERVDILHIHLTKKHRNVSDFDLSLLARESDGFSGSEIEESINHALFKSFSQNRDVVSLDICTSMQGITPLSVTMKEHIDALRTWAKERAKTASKPRTHFDSVIDFQKKSQINSKG